MSKNSDTSMIYIYVILGIIFISLLCIIFLLVSKPDYSTATIQKPIEGVPTFHIIMSSVGRPSLKRMLDSLKNELEEGDALTLIFDGKHAKAKAGYTYDWTHGFRCKLNIFEEEKNGGYYGHPVLNKYKKNLSPETTFYMFADDDDTYNTGSFRILRNKCKNPNTLYISKMTHTSNRRLVIPRQDMYITEGDIGKVNGIIPFKWSKEKINLGTTYTSDYRYYKDLEYRIRDIGDPIVFLPDIIYTVR